MINNLFGFYFIWSPKSNVGKKNGSLIVVRKKPEEALVGGSGLVEVIIARREQET